MARDAAWRGQAADKNAILLVHIKPSFLVPKINPRSDITDPSSLMKIVRSRPPPH